jgi:primosomal protein N' (replication factor Y)
MYASVIVNRPTYRRPPAGAGPVRDEISHKTTYTYRLPERLRELAGEGHLVQVPLGASTALGVIFSLSDSPPPDLPHDEIRDVAEILDPLPVVTSTQIDLARWVADEYLEPLRQAMRLMLPPGMEARTSIVVSQAGGAIADGLTEDESTALGALQSHSGSMPLSTLMGRLRGDNGEEAIHSLADRGLVETRFAFVPPKPAPPRVQYVRLLADDSTIDSAVPRLGHPSKQADVLLALARQLRAPLSLSELCEQVGCTVGPVRALESRGWVDITSPRTLVMALPVPTGDAAVDPARAPKQWAALSLLQGRGGPVELGELVEDAGVPRSAITALERKGLVRRAAEPSIVLLTLPVDRVIDKVVELRGAEKERAVLHALRGTPGRVWVGGLYAQTGAELGTLHKLAAKGLLTLHAEEYERPRMDGPERPHDLTPDQRSALRLVERELNRADAGAAPLVALLHGVTGSGKTEVYLHALDRVLEMGKRAIVLVPEISLTAQTVRRFEARFPDRIAVLHSQLSQGQRYAVWDRVRHGDADVLIGARSALFAPISRLGLIVVDESHGPSYKQSDPIPLPAYHARDVAIALGKRTGAVVLFGSATPDLVTYYRARKGTYRLLELPQRILSRGAAGSGPESRDHRTSMQSLPPVRVVDLRQELRAGNRSVFSRALQDALSSTLSAGEQAILFLNRRGVATFVLCRDCGYVARCPHCDIPLTLHLLGREGLICHRCNHREPAPTRCPECGSRRIRFFGLGTERVESALRELFPDARLIRWDRDTTTGLDHERYLQAFVDHRADLLIGTQMIAKGLDLPLVTLVGVISADTALHLPDFRSAERTFQLLTQVAGRAGRGRRGGQVIVQTYNPDHYAIRAAAGHDFAGFYQQELAYRRQMDYPPFNRLVALRFSHTDPARCRAEAERVGQWLTGEIERLKLPASLIGPAPCFFGRIQGRYRWQVVVRLPDPGPLLRDVALPWGWKIDVDPVSLL